MIGQRSEESEGGRRRPAGGVGREKNAFGERVNKNGAPGVDEREAAGRLERRGIRADGIRRAGRAVTRVLQVAGEVVMLERRNNEHRGIQHDEPLEKAHGQIQGYPKGRYDRDFDKVL